MATALVLSIWDVTEATTGGFRRIHALLDSLGGHAVLAQPLTHSPRWPTVPYPRHLGRRKAGVNWGMFNGYLPSTRRVVRGLLRHQPPAVAVLTSMWCDAMLPRINRPPVVLDAHDVNARAIAERFGDGHAVTRMIRARERSAVTRADHVIACSDGDAAAFQSLYNLSNHRITVVPNGVDTAAFDGPLPGPDAWWREQLGDAIVLLFMGKLDYRPNVEALDFLAGSVLPALEAMAPGRYRILVTGGPPPDRPPHPSMVFSGAVPTDRLRDHLRRADVCLAPIFTGGGTRLKILEYMAARRPVVATPKAAEGLEAEPGRDLLCVEPEAFADTILALAADLDRAHALGESGRHLVATRYDWSTASAPRWRAVLDRWLDPS